MRRNRLILTSLCSFLVLTGCSGGPSNGEITEAWNEYVKASGRCVSNLTFSDFEIKDVAREENHARAIVLITGEWTGPQPGMFQLPTWNLGGACDGIQPTTGKRRVQHELSLTKYDSGWRLDEIY